MNESFITPPGHVKFRAKKLFDAAGEVAGGSIAFLEPGGGGPVPPHTHSHDHLFIVTRGAVCIEVGGKTVIVGAGDAFRVDGRELHSVWNDSDGETVMVGLTVN
ncbi:hypothetical protein SDC9_195860 [bioreactor metagenome]|uniref:Cupin type-2 domain-containing protein n=1 Tax=bioreactor metagenome TaxID=1076179 RepID=A0A645IIX1_9ZZZZ